MYMCSGGRHMAWCCIKKGRLRMNEGKRLEVRGLQIKGDKMWIIYHILPFALILLFVIINDIYDMFDSYK